MTEEKKPQIWRQINRNYPLEEYRKENWKKMSRPTQTPQKNRKEINIYVIGILKKRKEKKRQKNI